MSALLYGEDYTTAIILYLHPEKVQPFEENAYANYLLL
ncbi:hypothetical protein JOC94_001678 [Bacillus thermophilus]|uniref:Uncharacterized protein n=1 Tax=Siminovitchia thermophila TaxID=1245522 RepID=A0ABS2R7Y8_9BACI|nr:hypothetical protein [Siminovitchia thermophila]